MSGRTLNKTELIGIVNDEPLLKNMPSGDPVVNLCVRTYDSWVDKNTGQKTTHTEYHSVAFTKRNAKNIVTYLKKGALVRIEAQLRKSKTIDKVTGKDRYILNLYGRKIQFLDAKPGAASADEKCASPVPSSADNIEQEHQELIDDYHDAINFGIPR